MPVDDERDDAENQDALARAASVDDSPAGDDDAEKKKNKARAETARVIGKAKVAELNRKHFVISNIGGHCLVGEFIPSSIDEN